MLVCLHEILRQFQVRCVWPSRLHRIDAMRALPLGFETVKNAERDCGRNLLELGMERIGGCSHPGGCSASAFFLAAFSVTLVSYSGNL